MNESAFMDKTAAPTKELLEHVLGTCHTYYVQMHEIAHNFNSKWSYYKGWTLKVFDSKKALLYFIPHKDAYEIRLTLRENELEQMLRNKSIAYMHDQVRESEKYSEGYLIDMKVSDADSASKCNCFITELIKLR